MAKILVPMWYYSSGYAGAVSTLGLTMAGSSAGYEVYKAFTTDDKEYLKLTNNIDLANPYTSGGVQGVMLVSDHFFSSTANRLYLYKSATSNYLSTTVKSISSVYGDGSGEGFTTYFYPTVTQTGMTKTLITYSTETSYQYYRITITPTSSWRIQNLVHGIIYDLPDSFRITEKEFSYKYKNSVVKTNLVGNIYYDGMQNNFVKREHTLNFEYLSETDKETLFTIFKLGKGGLPVWFIDDTSNNKTWMNVGMKSMKITEPAVNYFNVNINLVEY